MRFDNRETAVYLLALVEQHGYSLTADQLRRLHLEGLIECPLQDHPDRKVGSETVYPKGTGDLLLAICSQHQQKRLFSAIAWQLWRDGYPIPLPRIQTDLRKTAQEWERLRCALTHPRTRTFPGIVEIDSKRFLESGVKLVECPNCASTRTLELRGGILRFKSHDKCKTTTPNAGQRWARGETDWMWLEARKS